jgi:hypothetical protein
VELPGTALGRALIRRAALKPAQYPTA